MMKSPARAETETGRLWPAWARLRSPLDARTQIRPSVRAIPTLVVLSALFVPMTSCGASNEAAGTGPRATRREATTSTLGTGASTNAPGDVSEVTTPPTPNTVDTSTTTGPALAEGRLCDPGPSASAGIDESVPADRRGEALVEHLTGIDELAIPEEEEGIVIIYDDPNYGGVWGDRQGGWVVAVLDCSRVDADRIAEIAGGADAVRLIEVPYAFEKVNQFSNRLINELDEVGVAGDVWIDSTLTGRLIRVVVEDPTQLETSFGASVPQDAFVIEQGELAQDA